jgi:hypothetical protein
MFGNSQNFISAMNQSGGISRNCQYGMLALSTTWDSAKTEAVTPGIAVIWKFYEGDRNKAFALYFAEQHNPLVSSMSSPQI